METEKLTKYQKAKKRVARIRGFYNHLAVYIVVITALFILRGRINVVSISTEALGNPEFLRWFDWNFYGTPILWGIGLAFHGIKVFGNVSFFGRDWEERKIKEFMNEDKDQNRWK
ncbi:MAG: 2TM domain-containing protein [Aurantibacter sp.]